MDGTDPTAVNNHALGAAGICSPCLCQVRARALHLRRCVILNP